MDAAFVEAFLATRFGGAAGDVAHLGAGVWSQAFAFRRAGSDYVIRFGAHGDDFARDRLAAAFAGPALPVPAVLELGETEGGYYAIAERAYGGYIDDVDEAPLRSLLPALFAALDAMRLERRTGHAHQRLLLGDHGRGRGPLRSRIGQRAMSSARP